MSQVRIFQPSKTAMQSGRRGTGRWMVQFESDEPRFTDPLMGWIGSADTRQQLRLSFDSRDEAIAWAERNGYTYTLQEPQPHAVKPKSYADNFRT